MNYMIQCDLCGEVYENTHVAKNIPGVSPCKRCLMIQIAYPELHGYIKAIKENLEKKITHKMDEHEKYFEHDVAYKGY